MFWKIHLNEQNLLLDCFVKRDCDEQFMSLNLRTMPARLLDRSSYPNVFCRKSAFKSSSKFTGKTPRLRPATLLKKRLWHRYFPVNFEKFLRTPFLIEHLRWLLLTGINLCFPRVLTSPSWLPFHGIFPILGQLELHKLVWVKLS